MKAGLSLCHQAVTDALADAVRCRPRKKKIHPFLVYFVHILQWMHCKAVSIKNCVMLMVLESKWVDDPCVSIYFPKAFLSLWNGLWSSSEPKGDYISPLRPMKKNSFEAGWHKLKAEHKLLSCEVKSAVYQLVVIHIELTACVAFYLLSLFYIFPISVLCIIIRKTEMF